MRAALLAAWLVIAACGDASGPPGTAGSTGTPPPPSDTSAPAPIPSVDVTLGQNLGLTPADRIVTGLVARAWTASADDDVVEIRLESVIEFELAEITTLRLSADPAAPEFLSGARVLDNIMAETEQVTDLLTGTLLLQDWNPGEVMSGRYKGEETFSFWVDGRLPEFLTFDIGRDLEMPLGGVAEVLSGALVFSRVVEDSRCPPDVECVTAGRAVLEFAHVTESGERDLIEVEVPGRLPRPVRRADAVDLIYDGERPVAVIQVISR